MNIDVEKLEDGKDKEILKAIGDNLVPYVKRHDGFAKEITEDIEVTYKDYDGHENVLKIPAGAVVKVMDGCRAEITTKEDFEKNYVFHDEGKEVIEEKTEHKEPEKKLKKSGPLGIETLNS